MADLYEFIEEEAQKAPTAAAAKYRGLLKPLKAYAGYDTKVSLLSTITPRWQKKFRAWLVESYPATLGKEQISEHSAKRHLDSFKAVCRQAILAGMLPNVKLFEADESGVGEYRTPRMELSARGPLERLMAFFPTEARMRRAVDYILLSTLLAGMGWKNMSALKKADFDGRRLRLSRLGGVEVDLPEGLLQLLNRNLDTDADSPRLLVLPDAAMAAEADALARRFGLPSPHDAEPTLALWLRCAAETSTDHAAIYDFIDLASATLELAPDDFAQRLAQLLASVAADNGELTKRWYVMVCVKGSHGKDISEILLDKGVVEDPTDLYAPQDIQFKKHRNGNIITFNNPVVDRLLFVRQPLPAVQAIQRKLRGKGIFLASNRQAEEGVRRYSQVPEREVNNLKMFLGVRDDNRFYRSGVEAVGRRVRVADGDYKGCEGVIVEFHNERPRTINLPNKTTDSAGQPVRYFGVRILGESFALTPSIESSLLMPID